MYNHLISLFATIVGYIVTAALSLGGTMALTAAAPRFVLRQYRIRTGYKLAQEALWFLCVVLGAAAAAWSGMHVNRREQELLLVAALVAALWLNTWEARQRGTAHQIFLSLLTVVAVVLSFTLEARWFPAKG